MKNDYFIRCLITSYLKIIRNFKWQIRISLDSLHRIKKKTIFLFFSYVDFSFQKNFFNDFTKFISIFERFFYFLVIYWFFISYSMAQRTSTEVSRIIRSRTERVYYLDYLDCSKVMYFLVNVCIFTFSKKL